MRIGIHQGEVVFENDDIFGDAVNIAARIQAAAKPGTIYISESVNHNISNKKDIQSRFVKEEILKNVSQPVRKYQVLFAGSESIVAENPVIPVTEKGIAVLPFVNMSSDLAINNTNITQDPNKHGTAYTLSELSLQIVKAINEPVYQLTGSMPYQNLLIRFRNKNLIHNESHPYALLILGFVNSTQIKSIQINDSPLFQTS